MSQRSSRRRASPRPSAPPPRGTHRAVILAAVGLAVIGIGAALTWAWRERTAGVTPAGHRPDVILITIDTLRADRLGSYGRRDAATPVLDQLARRGVRFAEAVAATPLTLPSHATILTGVSPLTHGVRNNAGFVLGATPGTLAERFRAAGYPTAAFVSGFPLDHRFGLARGFDSYDDRFPRGDDPARPSFVERRGDLTVAATVAWLRQVPAAPRRPVFVWVHLFDPHAPYDPPEPFRSQFRDRPYDGEVAFSDQQVGVLLDEWKRIRGAGHEPFVLVTSDHGESLGEHGEPTHGLFIYDSTIRVPLIVAGPDIPSRVVAGPAARAIDVTPTLLDLAGVPPWPGVEGRSLRPAWTGGRPLAPEPVYVESLFGRLSFGWAPLFGWRERGLMYIDAPRPELFDTTADTAQLHNLAQARVEDVARMQRTVRAAVSNAPEARPAASAPDTGDRLRSLGYVGGASIAAPSLRDPKDYAAQAVRIENAISLERAEPGRAATEFRAVLADEPRNVLARRHLAIALTAARRYDEAGAELKTLLSSGDDDAETWVLLGEVGRLSGRTSEAIDAFDRAIARDPRIPDAYNGRAKTLVALGRSDQARQAFGQTLALAAEDAEALEGLGDLALAAGDFPGARAKLEMLAARDPGDSRVALKLGVVLVRLGNLDQAIGIFRHVAEREPRNVEAAVDLGGALAKSGRPAEAVPIFERAVAAGARSPVVWKGLAMARLESGNQAGAVDALRESLRLKPDQPGIRELLGKLRQ